MSVRIPATRTTSREGVNAAQTFFERAGCVFQEVAQQNDFGKDAYVDLADGDILTHLCVALQIKAGESFRLANGDYSIPVQNHAANWRRSTVPVFGLVYDPADQRLRWADLTGHLRANPQQETGTITVSRDAVLDQSRLHSDFIPAVAMYANADGSVALNLLSSDDLLQADAVYDAWALGRLDHRHLLILRRLILELRTGAMRRAIAALFYLGIHPDIFWTEHNWISGEIKARVKPSFRWSPEEIAYMLRAVGTEEWGRGTLGQCFDVLMREDPNVQAKIYDAIGILLKDEDLTTAAWAVAVALSYSGNAPDELAGLMSRYPALQPNHLFQEVSGCIRECGEISLY